jgi:uncharacterized RmlC-like cupin family protein
VRRTESAHDARSRASPRRSNGSRQVCEMRLAASRSGLDDHLPAVHAGSLIAAGFPLHGGRACPTIRAEAVMVEGHDGILVIRAGENCRDWNGIHYKEGLSGKNVGAKALSMNVATIPPGGVAYAHIHVGFEVMLYILAGRVRHEYGDGLKQVVENTAGDFIFIEPGVPHEVFNVSSTDPVVAVVARSDASEWANIIPYQRKP